MNDRVNWQDFPLADMIAGAEKELAHRVAFYPTFVANSQMTQAEADSSIACQRVILAHYKSAAKGSTQ